MIPDMYHRRFVIVHWISEFESDPHAISGLVVFWHSLRNKNLENVPSIFSLSTYTSVTSPIPALQKSGNSSLSLSLTCRTVSTIITNVCRAQHVENLTLPNLIPVITGIQSLRLSQNVNGIL